MIIENFIPIRQLCELYQVEFEFFISLEEVGLIPLEQEAEEHYIHKDYLSEAERIIRLHSDLNINVEGIDTVLHLLERIDKLQEELNSLKSKLKKYE